jgi:hypothetical protein
MTQTQDWDLVFIGRVRPRGRRGQRCKRLRGGDRPRGDDLTLVRFKRDGRDYWVLDRLLVKAEDY